MGQWVCVFVSVFIHIYQKPYHTQCDFLNKLSKDIV